MSATDFYAALGVKLPGGGHEANVKCFTNGTSHRNGDRTPSCRVNRGSGAWKCHGCGASGGAYDAAVALGRTSAEAMELVEAHGLRKTDTGRNGHEPAAPTPFDQVTEENVEKWIAQLTAAPATRVAEQRGWRTDVLRGLGVGWDVRKRRFTIPSRRADGVLGGVGLYLADRDARGDERKMLQVAGSKRGPFPTPERWTGRRTRVITEGEADAILGVHLRLPAIGVPGAEYPWGATDTARLAGCEVAYLLVDADVPGRRLMERIAEHLRTAGIEAVIVDLHPDRDDGADLTDWVEAHQGWPTDPNAVRADLLAVCTTAREVVATNATKATKPDVDPTYVASVAYVAPDREDERQVLAIHHDAYLGLAGRFAVTVDPHTEASMVGVLLSFLAMFGNAVGAGPHDIISPGEVHRAKFYPVVVGPTSSGRKGTAVNLARWFVGEADPTWRDRHAENVGSGEALMWAVRDARIEQDRKGEPVHHAGVEDKRLFVEESEFASLLRVCGRDGSIVSPIVRQAWDKTELRHTVKHNPVQATGAHITIVGAITPAELRRELTSTDAANGFANRFAFAWVERSKSLPRGGKLDPSDPVLISMRQELAETIEWAKNVGQVQHDETFWGVYEPVYNNHLNQDRPGMAGELLARGAPTVRRLAMIYALLDRKVTVTEHHARAALAVWRYIEASTIRIFGDALGDPAADRALDLIRRAGDDGLTSDEVKRAFSNHPGYSDALKRLEGWGLVTNTTEPSGGRPITRWHATKATYATKVPYGSQAVTP